MNQPQLYRPTPLLPATTRHDAKAVMALRSAGSVDLACIDTIGESQGAKADALTSVAYRALNGVALLGTVEQNLAMASPMSSANLAFITSTAASAFAQVIMDTASKLRRY